MADGMRMKPGDPMGGGPLGTRTMNKVSLSEMAAEHAFHLMLQTCTACHTRFREGIVTATRDVVFCSDEREARQ